MKNKKSKSKNILTCNITGIERMSNKDYLAAKANKKNTSVEEFKKFYINKEEYKTLKGTVQENGIDNAAVHADNYAVTLKSLERRAKQVESA